MLQTLVQCHQALGHIGGLLELGQHIGMLGAGNEPGLDVLGIFTGGIAIGAGSENVQSLHIAFHTIGQPLQKLERRIRVSAGAGQVSAVNMDGGVGGCVLVHTGVGPVVPVDLALGTHPVVIPGCVGAQQRHTILESVVVVILTGFAKFGHVFGIQRSGAVLILGEPHGPGLQAGDCPQLSKLIHGRYPLVGEVERLIDKVIRRIEQAVRLRGVNLIPIFQCGGGAGIRGNRFFADVNELIHCPVVTGLFDVQRLQHIQVHGDAHGVHLARQRIQLTAVNIGVGHAAGNILRFGIGEEIVIQRHHKAACNLRGEIIPVQPHQVGHTVRRGFLRQILVESAAGGTGEGFLHDFDVGILRAERFQHGLNFRDFRLGIRDGDGALHLVHIGGRCRRGRIIGFLRAGGGGAGLGVFRRSSRIAARQNTEGHHQCHDQCQQGFPVLHYFFLQFHNFYY